MKRDPYNNIKRWDTWKEKHFNKPPKGIRKSDWSILIQFLKDMELGINVPIGKKGKRGPGTLLNLSSHNKLFLENLSKPLLALVKMDLHNLEQKISTGKILKKNGKKYIAFGNYIKDFKVFWNWGLRTKTFNENIIEDITSVVDKPSWVYLSEENIRKLFNKLSLDYRTICFLLYDSGMRVTEANSIKISDFEDDFSKLNISDEISKTFGRTINLKLSTQLIKDYVKEHELKDDDYFLIKKPFTINKYLRYHCVKLFGDKISHPKAKGRYSSFTMYDIRHNAACFWFNKYPTHKGLMYRFGWRKADKIEYYSEFLGVSDEIADADMILGEDRDKLYKLETENKETRKQIESQGEQILALEKSNKEMRQSSEDFLKEIKEQHYIESKERIKEIAKHIK
jgi:integrase